MIPDIIESLCRSVSMQVTTLVWTLTFDGGELERLDKCIEQGGYATSETSEAIRLSTAERELRRLADEIKHRREALIANEPVKYLAAAE